MKVDLIVLEVAVIVLGASAPKPAGWVALALAAAAVLMTAAGWRLP